MTTSSIRETSGVMIASALAVALIIIVAHPDVVSFSSNDVGDYITAITPLFFLALFVERALEVFVAVWRSPASDRLELELNYLKAQANPEAAKALQAKEGDLLSYKSRTRNIAYAVSVSAGLVISALGIRAIQMLLDADSFAELPDLQRVLVQIADVIITGALIAGSADGIHRILSAMTSFVDSAKNRAKG